MRTGERLAIASIPSLGLILLAPGLESQGKEGEPCCRTCKGATVTVDEAIKTAQENLQSTGG
jgi:hypothetical protein